MLKKIITKLIPKKILREIYVSTYDRDVGKEVSQKIRESLLGDIDKERYSEGLEALLSAYKNMFFNAQKEGQDFIRGAYFNTQYLLGLIKGQDEKSERQSIIERVNASRKNR